MRNEKQTDLIIAELLKNAGINFFPNGSEISEIQNALSTASKRGTNKKGFPEFTAVVKDFVIFCGGDRLPFAPNAPFHLRGVF